MLSGGGAVHRGGVVGRRGRGAVQGWWCCSGGAVHNRK